MRPIDADALIEFCAERWIPLNIDAVNMQPTIQPEKAQLFSEDTTSDTISRTEVVEHLRRMLESTVPNTDYDEGFIDGIEFGISTVSTMPTIQPEPKEGHWILYDKRFPWRTWYKCSECGNYLDFSGVNGGRAEPHYCPKCGAKMKGE